MGKLQGWTKYRIAREAGVRVSTVENFTNNRLISGWAEYRIRGTLAWLGVAR